MDGRTDLAMEAYALWKQDAQDTTQLPGVKAREEDAGGVHITRVDILDERGQAALGKPFWERAAWRRSSWCALQRIFYSRRQLSRSTRWRQWTRQDFVQLSN